MKNNKNNLENSIIQKFAEKTDHGLEMMMIKQTVNAYHVYSYHIIVVSVASARNPYAHSNLCFIPHKR